MYLHLSVLLYSLTWAFICLCPYSKVEESFNMQALHDIAFLQANISQYDHVKFPGVVPRTFVGAALLSFICAIPISTLMPFVRKFTLQLLVRFILGTINVGCFLNFVQTVRRRFGDTVYVRLMWISLSQFHFFFYASRSLPNTFALPFMLLSLSSLLRTRDKQFVVLAGIAILIFRSELILFYGPCLLYGLAEGNVKLRPTLFLTVFITGLGCIGFSLIVDSIFWQRLVWPEGEVFYYNTVLNKSGQWGIFPFYWYFTSALPRALLMTVVLLPLWATFAVRAVLSGRLAYDRTFSLTSVGLISSALLFVLLYSWLPHKELRFIIYTVPVFNLAAAIVWAHLECSPRYCGETNCIKENRSSSSTIFNWLRYLVVCFCYAHLIANALCTTILLWSSRQNYPGGVALYQLNHWSQLNARQDVHVHICNLAAQTGVTRFLEEHQQWIYNKTEHIENNIALLESAGFTHIISEWPPDRMHSVSKAFEKLFTVHGFSGINIKPTWRLWKSIQIQTLPRLFVYVRRENPL